MGCGRSGKLLPGLDVFGIMALEERWWVYENPPYNSVVRWLPFIFLIAVVMLRIFKEPGYRVGAYFLGTITPVLVFVGILILGPVYSDYAHRQKFDAGLWRNQDEADRVSNWPPRLCMVDDLISSGRLDHLNKDQVISLLGSPYGKEFPLGSKECDIHYYLGPERGFVRMDSEWLFITFGKDGKVSRYWIYHD